MADAQKPSSMNLYQKLAAISGEVGAIKKGGHNREQNFDFIEYAAVAGELRKLFAKHGVVIVPRMQQTAKQTRKEFTTAKGARGTAVLVDMTFTILNADKPEEKFTVTWTGEAIDYGDKATNKAATSALKYYLMRQFNISEKGDDPDAESPDRGSAPQVAAKPQPKLATQKQLEAIPELARVKGKSAEWIEAIRERLGARPTAEVAQDVIDKLNELEDSQEQSTSQQASPSRADRKAAVAEVEAELDDYNPNAAENVLEIMNEDEPPTKTQIDRFRELRDQLRYPKASTEHRLKQLKSRGALGAQIGKLKADLIQQEREEGGAVDENQE